MCQEKKLVDEFGEEVVLCCDDHITEGLHYDKLQNLEWRVPGTEVPAKVSAPLKVMRERAPCFA